MRIPFTYDIQTNGQPVAEVEGFAEVEAVHDGRDVDGTAVHGYVIDSIRLFVIGTGRYPSVTVEPTGWLRLDIESHLWSEHRRCGLFHDAAMEAEDAR